MEVHACLWNNVRAFDFCERDLQPIAESQSRIRLHVHRDEASFLRNSGSAEVLLTWDFPAHWYALCPALKLIMTPAAGNDWIAPAEKPDIQIIHGSFHGAILAESLLAAVLYMNHRMPLMIDNFRQRAWDRNLQHGSRLLANQTVLIVGMGHIGEACARLIAATGARVIGVRRHPERGSADLDVQPVAALPRLLPTADHVVLLMPGGAATDGFMNRQRLLSCRRGALIYNFGRGNALRSDDLLGAMDHLGGAFLDVTETEPLPPDSPLWEQSNIMITPHSSCVYEEYRALYIAEVIEHLSDL